MRPFLAAAALICAGLSSAADPSFQVTSRLELNNRAGWFGGFSGAEITPDGSQITLLTDKSSLVTARLTRSNGKLTGVTFGKRIRLRNANNRRLRSLRSDAEGLAIDDAGRAFVSFEQRTRVAQLDLATGVTRVLPRHPDFARFEENKGPEALAIHPNGTLFTLPERSAAKGASFPLYAFAQGNWRITHKIPRRGQYLVVGADIDARGMLYLLERAVSPLGFRTRIRRFGLDPANLTEETLLTTLPGQYDNLEAISIWQDAAGRTRATVISDDNFLSIQRTEMVEFILRN